MKDTGLEAGLTQVQQYIDTLLVQAQDNEAIQERCHQHELALIASNGLGEYLHQHFGEMSADFAFDAISLHLYDAEQIIHRFIEDGEIDSECRDSLPL